MRSSTRLLTLLSGIKEFRDDFSSLKAGWTGAGFAVAGGAATITPTQGSELLTNGDFETWASATDPGTWTETLAGASTLNREGTDVHAGSFACRCDIDASNNIARPVQTLVIAANTWLQVTGWMKSNIAAKTARIDYGGQSGGSQSLTTSYVQYAQCFRTASANGGITPTRVSAASASLYFDDFSATVLTNVFAYRTYPTPFCSLRVGITRVANTQTGLLLYVNATNYVLAYMDGAGTTRLDKVVGGTLTANVATAANTYGAGQELRLDHQVDDTWDVYYNNASLFSGTISDAVFKTGPVSVGLFSTYASNSFDNFSARPV